MAGGARRGGAGGGPSGSWARAAVGAGASVGDCAARAHQVPTYSTPSLLFPSLHPSPQPPPARQDPVVAAHRRVRLEPGQGGPRRGGVPRPDPARLHRHQAQPAVGVGEEGQPGRREISGPRGAGAAAAGWGREGGKSRRGGRGGGAAAPLGWPPDGALDSTQLRLPLTTPLTHPASLNTHTQLNTHPRRHAGAAHFWLFAFRRPWTRPCPSWRRPARASRTPAASTRRP
jgi:hypothetical protein